MFETIFKSKTFNSFIHLFIKCPHVGLYNLLLKISNNMFISLIINNERSTTIDCFLPIVKSAGQRFQRHIPIHIIPLNKTFSHKRNFIRSLKNAISIAHFLRNKFRNVIPISLQEHFCVGYDLVFIQIVTFLSVTEHCVSQFVL